MAQKSVMGKKALYDTSGIINHAQQNFEITEKIRSEKNVAAIQVKNKAEEDAKKHQKGLIIYKNRILELVAACLIIAAIVIMVLTIKHDNKNLETSSDISVTFSAENSTKESSTEKTVELNQANETIASIVQSITNTKTGINSEVSDTEAQISAVVALEVDAKKDDVKPQPQDNSVTKKSITKKSRTSMAKAPIKPTLNQNHSMQTPTPAANQNNSQTQTPAVSKVSINDFKLYVTYGDPYTLIVKSPQDGQKYNYIFKAKENKGDDMGVISVTRAGLGSFSWDPPKEDTYYHITLQVKGINGQITGVPIKF